jgi:hypothetical protein
MLMHVRLACTRYLTRFAHFLELQLTYTHASLTLRTSVFLSPASRLPWIHIDGVTNHQCPQSIILRFAPLSETCN